MKSTIKVWAGLGLATALMGVGLAGCSGEAGEGEGGEAGAEASQSGEAGESGEGGEGEGGEGGESGESGVDVSKAASDPVTYGSALAIVEAHALAARDAYAAGDTEAAAEMFGHPVSEVLSDMDPVFEQLGVADFKATLNEASAAALKPDNGVVVGQRFDDIITALRGAGEKAPAGDLSRGAVAASVVADQIDRATSMYQTAAATDASAAYLDGYGFYKSAQSAFERGGSAIKTYNSGLHADIAAALGLLESAYPGPVRPDALETRQGALLGAASKVQLGLPAQS